MIMVAAVDNNWAIGKGNDLLFKITDDQLAFRSITNASSACIIGRNTYETLPIIANKNGEDVHGLKDRIIICLSKTLKKKTFCEHSIELINSALNKVSEPFPGLDTLTMVIFENNIDNIIKNYPYRRSIAVIGGESIYKQFYDYCDYAYITKVDIDVDGADKHLMNLDNDPDWTLVSESDIFHIATKDSKPIEEDNSIKNVYYRFCIYKRMNNKLESEEDKIIGKMIKD